MKIEGNMLDAFEILGGFALFMWLVIWLSIRHQKNYVGPWEVHAVCDCGWWTYAPFGKIFHVHDECCPRCGEPKYGFKIRTRRINKGEWETKESR